MPSSAIFARRFPVGAPGDATAGKGSGNGATSGLTVPPLIGVSIALSSQTGIPSSSTTDSASDENTSSLLSPTAASTLTGNTSSSSSTADANSSSTAVTPSTISSSSTSTGSLPSSTPTAPPKTVSAAVIGGSVAGSLIALLAIGICILFIIRRRRHVWRRLRAERRQAIPLEGDLFMSEKLHINYGQSHSSRAVGLGSHLQVIPPSAITSAESGHRTEQLEMGGSGKSQIASLQDSNTEMRTTIGRLMGRMQYLEAQLESGDSVAGMSPPTYVSS
ncbi:hypothetical protein BT96DRAFT_1027135 [Gymnopus androsaceus JB14]|uniref:Mid2 domain-containing protein n=1 Tax=Gymnopus androsaceus JB14 TaxID=1447944 RepID=A0A6A4GDV9_9AGAR|nr:hypothetical protein BT96DRAFT_1027135 [Gymnopus androsaceus JB14]